MNNRNLASQISVGRERNGLSQSELAAKLGVSQGTISNWESGKGRPDGEQLTKLKTFFGVRLFSGGPAATDSEGPSIVGAWLSKARQKHGLTQQELADKSGVTQVTISHIETGRARNPQPRTIKLLEDAVGVPFEKEARRELERESEVKGVGQLADFNPHDKSEYPNEPGVYVFYDISERPVYVGHGQNIADRIREHEQKFWFKAPIVNYAAYVRVEDETLRKQIEDILIRFLKSNAVINKQQVDR